MWEGKVIVTLFDLKGERLSLPAWLPGMIQCSLELPPGLSPLILAVALEPGSQLAMAHSPPSIHPFSSSSPSPDGEANNGVLEPS